jgi:phosphohistidine phosphatase SixA
MHKPLLRILFVFLVFLAGTQAQSQTTTVYLVRHAEKNVYDPNTKDPALTRLGEKRAKDLAKLLADKQVAAIFTTHFRRTNQTATPIAERMNLQPLIYDPSETRLLVEWIKRDYSGKTVLIVGHSNTLVPQVEAFGGRTSFNKIEDSDYRNLIRLTINGSDVRTEELKFGH